MSAYFANGSEGRAWQAMWCDRCALDHSMHGDGDGPGCEHFLLALIREPVPAWIDETERYGFTFPPAIRCTAFAACGDCGETVELDADGWVPEVRQREYVVRPDGSLGPCVTDRVLTSPTDREERA